jgi:hypothetical protein
MSVSHFLLASYDVPNRLDFFRENSFSRVSQRGACSAFLTLLRIRFASLLFVSDFTESPTLLFRCQLYTVSQICWSRIVVEGSFL